MAGPHADPTTLSADELDQLKNTFVTACRILANEGVSEAAFNVSCRLAGGMMMASPVTSPTLVTADNLEIFPIAQGSTSFKAHPAIYEARPDVNAIVHVHPPYAVAFSTLNEEFRPIHHYGAPFHGKITTYRSPGQTASKDRAQELARQLGDNRVILQQGHGSIAVGNDLKEAVLLTLYLEEACKTLAMARQMGQPEYLAPEVSEKIAGQILKPRSQNKAWRHYADKLRIVGHNLPSRSITADSSPELIKKVMQAEFVDVRRFPKLAREKTKKLLYNSDEFHVWVHNDESGKKGPMHKHTADQIFYCLQGECTFRFPNGESEALKPGMVVTIPKGQLYQLHNTGSEPMLLLGSRAEAAGKVRRADNDAVISNVKGEYVVEGKLARG